MHAREALRQALHDLALAQLAFADPQAFAYHRAHGSPRSVAGPLRSSGPPPASGGETIAGAMRRMASGDVRATELLEQAYAQIDAHGAALNVFSHVRPRQAAREAEQLGADRRCGGERGALHGVPVAIGDGFQAAGLPAACRPVPAAGARATADTTALARLRAAGAVIIGTTGAYECGRREVAPRCRNPWDPGRLAGGGAAAAVATGMALAALDTDTGMPAALCGVVGFRPTRGLVSVGGGLTRSRSTVGLATLTKNVEDAALMLDVLVGRGEKTGGSDAPGRASFRAAAGAAVLGLRIGVPVAGLGRVHWAVARAFADAVALFRDLGITIVEVDEPAAGDFADANRSYLARLSRAPSDIDEPLDGHGTGPGVAFLQTRRFRATLRQRMLRLFGSVDLLALPTSKVPAPRPEESDGLLLLLHENCVPWSLLGFPAISLPCGAAPGNLPLGLELVAAPHNDALLVAVGSAFETAAAVSYV